MQSWGDRSKKIFLRTTSVAIECAHKVNSLHSVFPTLHSVLHGAFAPSATKYYGAYFLQKCYEDLSFTGRGQGLPKPKSGETDKAKHNCSISPSHSKVTHCVLLSPWPYKTGQNSEGLEMNLQTLFFSILISLVGCYTGLFRNMRVTIIYFRHVGWSLGPE